MCNWHFHFRDENPRNCALMQFMLCGGLNWNPVFDASMACQVNKARLSFPSKANIYLVDSNFVVRYRDTRNFGRERERMVGLGGCASLKCRNAKAFLCFPIWFSDYNLALLKCLKPLIVVNRNAPNQCNITISTLNALLYKWNCIIVDWSLLIPFLKTLNESSFTMKYSWPSLPHLPTYQS